ncbi:MAG: GNAT family N-acetyltransferase, partial [Gemmatimonadales bacterium]
DQMDKAVQESIDTGLTEKPAGSAVLVAESIQGKELGFIHLQTDTDFFTHEDHGHVSDIIVTEEGEGKGVGRALMRAAEDWARGKGHRLLTLNVFGDNTRAVGLYKRLGYRSDLTKMVKEIPPSDAGVLP